MENGSGKAGNSEQYQLRQITRCFIRWRWLAIKREEGRGGCIEYCEHAWFTPFSISFHFSCSLLFSPFFFFTPSFMCPFCVILFVPLFFFFFIYFVFLYLHSFCGTERKKEIVEWTSSSYCRNYYWSFSHGSLINMFFLCGVSFFFFFSFSFVKLDRNWTERNLNFLIKHCSIFT